MTLASVLQLSLSVVSFEASVRVEARPPHKLTLEELQRVTAYQKSWV
ncbi:hypothetical protein POG22_21180 [Geitlerinema sp. CS-897]|nr:hypothetical protein [Geitlerinema sp. CS-897]